MYSNVHKQYKQLTWLLKQVADIAPTVEGESQLRLYYSLSDSSNGKNGDDDVDKSDSGSDVALIVSSKRNATGSENTNPAVNKNTVKESGRSAEVSNSGAVAEKKGKTVTSRPRTAKSNKAEQSSAGKQKQAKKLAEKSPTVDEAVC
jgi:glucan-binding YG repeat protein